MSDICYSCYLRIRVSFFATALPCNSAYDSLSAVVQLNPRTGNFLKPWVETIWLQSGMSQMASAACQHFREFACTYAKIRQLCQCHFSQAPLPNWGMSAACRHRRAALGLVNWELHPHCCCFSPGPCFRSITRYSFQPVKSYAKAGKQKATSALLPLPSPPRPAAAWIQLETAQPQLSSPQLEAVPMLQLGSKSGEKQW